MNILLNLPMNLLEKYMKKTRDQQIKSLRHMTAIKLVSFIFLKKAIKSTWRPYCFSLLYIENDIFILCKQSGVRKSKSFQYSLKGEYHKTMSN